MGIKFFLNKILKCDNIEYYSLRELEELKKCYEKFIKETGSDPDFPNLPFGGDGNTITFDKSNKDDLGFDSIDDFYNN